MFSFLSLRRSCEATALMTGVLLIPPPPAGAVDSVCDDPAFSEYREIERMSAVSSRAAPGETAPTAGQPRVTLPLPDIGPMPEEVKAPARISEVPEPLPDKTQPPRGEHVITLPPIVTPGHNTMAGTRMPPS